MNRILRTSAVKRTPTFIHSSERNWAVVRGEKRHITERLNDGDWRGYRCFILGGGPSLIGFDFARLIGEKTIATNRMFESAPFADILFSMDQRFYRWVNTNALGATTRERFATFSGIKLWLDTMNLRYDSSIYYVRGLHAQRFPPSLKTGVWHGANSGYGALQVAMALGASPIYLLGYDMKHADGRSHSHSGYPIPQRPHQVDHFRRPFEAQAPLITQSGIRVVNLNPDSALRCFEFSTFAEVMNDVDSIVGIENARKDRERTVDNAPRQGL